MAGAHLTPLDATFLELEDADAAAHMHIGALMLFDPPPNGETPLLEELLVHVDERLDALPRYRQRLSQPTVGRLGRPRWCDDEAFDLRAHVRHAALPSPGTEAELLEWAEDFYSHRLDRSRPLWEIVLLDGVAGGGWAIALKVHHCLVDGIGAVELTGVLLDTTADRDGVPALAAGPARDPLDSLIGAARATADLARHPAHVRGVLARAGAIADVAVRDELVGAPGCSLNAPIGKQRRLAAVNIPLDDLRAIRTALGGTINDAVLTLTTGGLRRLLVERGENPPGRGLRAMVPVSIRSARDALAQGNRVSSLFVELPVAEPDPLAAHRAVCRASAWHKAAHHAEAGRDVVSVAALAPPVVHSVLARTLFGSRLFNVTVTNVRGSDVPQWALGCRMRHAIPLVPLAAGHTIGVAVLSYAGDVCFGIQADRARVPDIDSVAAGIADTAEALLAATRRG